MGHEPHMALVHKEMKEREQGLVRARQQALGLKLRVRAAMASAIAEDPEVAGAVEQLWSQVEPGLS